MVDVRVPWVRALIATALFFLPTGVVALALCWSAMKAAEAGDAQKAARAARNARIWSWVTFGLGAVLYVVIIGALLLLGAFS